MPEQLTAAEALISFADELDGLHDLFPTEGVLGLRVAARRARERAQKFAARTEDSQTATDEGPASGEADGDLSASERDAVMADLGKLLEALGLGDYARPQSPYEVMLECIAEVAKIRAAERARILQIAERTQAVVTGDEGTSCYFADLIREMKP